VLTGETGAGKSILLDSLGLALGMRADAGLVRAGQNQASVTATFDIANLEAPRLILQELGLDADDMIIVRRMVAEDGKSRCFINDQSVSVTALKRIGETLVEIHGQHDQRGLLDMRTHMQLVDDYGRHGAAVTRMQSAYLRWQSVRSELQQLRLSIEESIREQDYLRHMAGELRSLDARPGEEEELATLRLTMMQSEKLSETITSALESLQSHPAAETQIQSAQRLLIRAGGNELRFQTVIDALERAQVELQEAVGQLESQQRSIPYDQARLEEIEERLFALKAMARKYHVSADELPGLLAEVEGKLTTLDSQSERIAALETQVNAVRADYLAAAQILSDKRAQSAQKLQKALAKELEPLKMGRCRFRVVQEELKEEQWSANGTDSIRFEAATNPGQPYAALHKIASGGELSRFMLALKVVLASVKSTPTLIFDEVDTGTGGAVADAIGARLAILSDTAQVLVVTHLPQVAARGTQHLFIEKSERKKQTQTAVRTLDVAERKEELARMLAGAIVTDEARGAAVKLLEAAS
jgi:DNA repair protein RecN (Recombination protein N)